MSFPAYCWAIEQSVANASERAVLSVLADFADARGMCFPSVGTIAQLCGMSRRGVGYTLQRLVERKLLAITGNTSRRYFHLAMEAAGDVARETRARPAQARGDACANPADARAADAQDSRNRCAQTCQEPVTEPLSAGAPDHEQPAGRTKAKPVHHDGNGDAADRSRRGTRLPPDWQPPAEAIARVERELPQVDWRTETDKFRDYWIAQPGQRGCKLDWPATWRNWMRNSLLYGARRNSGGSGAVPLRLSPTAPPPGGPWELRLRTYKERGLWSPDWGPKPGEEGCRVPKEVMKT